MMSGPSARTAAVALFLLTALMTIEKNGSAFAPQRIVVGMQKQKTNRQQPNHHKRVSPSSSSSVLRLIDVDAVTNAVSVDQIPRTTMGTFVSTPPPPPAAAAVVPPPTLPTVVAVPSTESSSEDLSATTAPVAAVLGAPPAVPPPLGGAAPAVAVPSPDGGSVMTLPTVDLPLPALAVGAVAAFAAATFAMRGSKDEREQEEDVATAPIVASSSKPTGSSSSSTAGPDLSIPYDAAARYAYEQSDRSMSYDAFRKKYEADAIADVKAKRKQLA